MTLQEYEEKLLRQNNACDICKKPATAFKRSLAVDHNHKTGKVRGILCMYCNHRFVGRFTLLKARVLLEYLEKYESESDYEKEEP